MGGTIQKKRNGKIEMHTLGKLLQTKQGKKLSELKKGKFLGENSPCSKKNFTI